MIAVHITCKCLCKGKTKVSKVLGDFKKTLNAIIVVREKNVF